LLAAGVRNCYRQFVRTVKQIMSSDLPIYSQTLLRTGLQFAALDRLKGRDDAAVWEKADALIAQMEGAADLADARRIALDDFSKNGLIKMHAALFSGRPNAGGLRSVEIRPLYRGQDCAPPQFISRSLDNLFSWIHADSFNDIHPIERTALTLTRIVDIWPFEFGNLTAAVVFSNSLLRRAGLTPFFVPPEHMREFERVIAQSMSIEMQPLINVVYNTIRREMEALGQP